MSSVKDPIFHNNQGFNGIASLEDPNLRDEASVFPSESSSRSLDLEEDAQSQQDETEPISLSPSSHKIVDMTVWKKFLTVFLVACVGLMVYNADVFHNLSLPALVERKPMVVPMTNNDRPPSSSQSNNHHEIFEIRHLQWADSLLQEKDKLYTQLRQNYGPDYFEKIFLALNEIGEYQPRKIFTSVHGQSQARFQRKLTIKLLEAAMAEQQSQQIDAPVASSKQQPPSSDSKNYHSQLIWANGGHSSSAGHGNFFDESSTAVLGKALTPVFRSVGIDFVANNYAMGGTSSGEEVALCVEQIFGRDVDVITWDYAMTDAGHQEEWKHLLYTYHTALAKNHPVAIGMDLGTYNTTRLKVYDELEHLGMTAMYMDHGVLQQMKDAIPDTQTMNNATIQSLGRYIQRFKCGGRFEEGDPGCKAAKFNWTACTDRPGLSPWHPGWKMHALIGNAWALYVVEALAAAVEDLERASQVETLQSIHNRLSQDEEYDYLNVVLSDIPARLSPVANWILKSDNEVPFGNMNLRELYKRRSFCHTALLPAETRYKGLLTQDPNSTFDNYYTGIPQPEAGNYFYVVNTDEYAPLQLSYEPKWRVNCEYLTHIDYKDNYFLTGYEGWKTLTIPNDAEQQYYSIDTSQMMGMIIMCLTGCDWNECAEGDLRKSFDQGPLSMVVNGVSVTNYTQIGRCWALENDPNIYKWTPNSEGKFDIAAKLENTGNFTYIRISSFILV